MDQASEPPRLSHPELGALLAYWGEKSRGGGGLPARRDIDPIEMRPWLGHLLLLEVIDGGADFRYRLHGSELVRLFGADLTGRRVSELASPDPAALLAEYRQAARDGRPCYIEQKLPAAATQVSVSKLILPLASDGRAVDQLLVGIYRLGRPAAGLAGR